MSPVKLVLLLIAMVMIGLVLFLGYKLDLYEERRKRKERNAENQKNSKFQNDYTDFNPIRTDYTERTNNTNTLTSTIPELKNITLKSNKYSEEFDKTAVIERIDLSKLESATEEEKSFNNNVYREMKEDDDLEKKDDEVSDEENDDELYGYEDYNSSTMVFDTTSVKEFDILDKNSYVGDEIDLKNEKEKQTRKSSSKKTVKQNKTKTVAKSTTKKSNKTNLKK